MSKIKSDKITYQNSNFVVELNSSLNLQGFKKDAIEDTEQENLVKNRIGKLIDEANQKAQNIILNAQKEAENIISDAKKEAQELVEKTNLEIENQTKERMDLVQEEIENHRIEKAKEGYEEGHKDGLVKIQEELDEKIKSFDNFLNMQFEAKNKILKSLNKDIVQIISTVSRKILLKEMNPQILDLIIKKTILLLEKKENVSIFLSEKYAKLILELQKGNLENEDKLDLSELKNYENFEIVCNSKLADDTIIIENLKERFDASINAQIDVIIENIYETCLNQNFEFCLEEKNEIELSE